MFQNSLPAMYGVIDSHGKGYALRLQRMDYGGSDRVVTQSEARHVAVA